MSDTQTTPQAADDKKRVVRAKHGYVDANGDPVKKIEDAHGISYTDIATGKQFIYLPGNDAAMRMLSVFGMKTKATNEASANRQDDESDQDDVSAIEAAFAQIDTGVWREPGEGAAKRGPKYDKDLLAAVIVDLLGAKATGDVMGYRERLDERSYYAKILSKTPIMAEYMKRLAARGDQAPDDLSAIA